ncbi:MAG: hypothetical protein KC656_02925 [Myxococcales bacterium]|nr:hypothetical protein [Myxococcales bacterium]MCB9672467.1 hypothetical protein [Alphaproteobacteria bacterium]MCB9692851.1 hypothetical protein [Alphaproteobacteria bacterium]
MDLMLTLTLVAAVCAVSALGLVALPWSEAELEGSADAFRALGEGARGLARAHEVRGGTGALSPQAGEAVV